MKITVITINLNNRFGLEKTIKSIINQSFQDFEYIIIDGGSTDGSINIIEEYKNKLHYWISEPDKGIYNAMNKGIHAANGEYLLFLNSGDKLFHKDTLLEAASYLGSHDIIYGDLRYDREGQFTDASYPDKITFKYLYNNYLPHPSSFIKKQTLLENGLYDEKYRICADWVFFIKAICSVGVSYLHIDQIISIYDTQGLSAKAEHQSTIKLERESLIKSAFGVYVDDYIRYSTIESKITSMETRKLFRILKFFGFYKSPLK